MEPSSGVVMVVDDHEYNRDVLGLWLKRQGHEVIYAENGLQALESLKQNEIDLMLLDVMMPEMNGYQVLESIKQNEKLRHIPVVVISALDELESVIKCIELGAEDYLFKPFNMVILQARIYAALEKQRLRKQEEIFRKQISEMKKLADLGTMASGVAHELNSPLQVITGTADSLIHRVESGEADKDYLCSKLNTILRNAWRCADISNALRIYSQAPVIQFEENNLNDIVIETVSIFEKHQAEFPTYKIDQALLPDIPKIFCDKRYIIEAILHLLNNARDAMPNGGKITIDTAYDDVRQLLTLVVSDTGTGVREDIRERIFDPFFTTKPIGEGTGLGLSIVSGVIRAHGGKIELTSIPGQGTSLKLYLLEKPEFIEGTPPQITGGRFDDIAYG